MRGQSFIGATQNRPLLILIRHSSRDSIKQTNPEKYNLHTSQIMNLATQLAIKELLKIKMFVAIHEHHKQYLIENFSTYSRFEGTITMIMLQCTELHFLLNNHPPFPQHEKHIYNR